MRFAFETALFSIKAEQHAGDDSLASILKLETIAEQSVEYISQIWKDYFASKVFSDAHRVSGCLCVKLLPV